MGRRADPEGVLIIVLGGPVALSLLGLGLRVIIRARHQGAATDRLVGMFFACLGVTPLVMAAPDPALIPPAWAPAVMAAGHAVLSLGFAALALFNWRCFGPRPAIRKVAAGMAIAGLALAWGLQGWIEGFAAPGGGVVKLTALLRAAVIAWAFAESLRFARLMERRAALGLADPVTTNRFWLWALWTGSILLAIGLVIAMRFLLSDFGPQMPAIQRVPALVTVAALGGLAGAALWLAFLPPAWFVARLEQRSA